MVQGWVLDAQVLRLDLGRNPESSKAGRWELESSALGGVWGCTVAKVEIKGSDLWVESLGSESRVLGPSLRTQDLGS